MNRRFKSLILVSVDIFAISMSMALTIYLRFDGYSLDFISENRGQLLSILLASVTVKLTAGYICKLYSSLWRYAGTYELLSVAAAMLFSNLLILIYAITIYSGLPETIFIISFFTDTSLIGGTRLAYRVFRKLLAGGLKENTGLKRILVVGGGEAGASIVKELKNNFKLKCVPAVIVDDDPNKLGKKLNGIPVLGNRHDICRLAESRNIQEIIIAIPSASRKDINDISRECMKTKCKVRILPSLSELIEGTVSIEKVRDVNIDNLLGREPITLDMEEVTFFLKNRVVLVTGGGGSIGSELCRQIAEFGPRQLIILDNYENAAYDIQNELKFKYPDLNLSTVIANIREKARMETVFRLYRPEIVFHAAAHKHVPLMEENPTEAIKNNVFGTLNVVECADKYQAERFVLISTDKAVNPTNIMGATKRIAEMIIQATNRHSQTEFVAVRFGNVLGSNGSVIPLFKKQIEHGGPVTVTHPEITRFFMTIHEAVQLVLQAGAMANGGEIFVLDMGQPVKILDLAKNLIKLSGFEPDEDIKIEFTGLRPGEKLYEELLMAEEGLRTTKNKKIFIAPPVFSDLLTLKREISKLNETIINNRDELFELIPRIVPAYRRAQ